MSKMCIIKKQVCKELGRHRHIDYYQNQESCELGNQGKDIQHIHGIYFNFDNNRL